QMAHNDGAMYAMGTVGTGTYYAGTGTGAGAERSSTGTLGDNKKTASVNSPVLVGMPDDETIFIGKLNYVTDFAAAAPAVKEIPFDSAAQSDLTEHTILAGTAVTDKLSSDVTVIREGDALRIGLQYTTSVTSGAPGNETTVTTDHTNLMRYMNVGTNLYRTSGTVGAEDFLYAFGSTETVGTAGLDKGVHKTAPGAITVGDFTVISSDESILTVHYNAAEGYVELRSMPNAFGQVTVLVRHNYTNVSRVFRVEVTPMSDLTEDPNHKLTAPKVVYGENFALALMSDGTVWAWGDNSSSQLGDGTVPTNHFIPTSP
ncbi:MAG: RCC1 domain-containing protein, partial [Pseudoflavonifractor sp.]